MKRKGVIDISVLMAVIFFVMAVIILFSVVRGFGVPHKQTAFANTELLRLTMNKACIDGSATMDGFELPQTIPPDFGGVYDIFPRIFVTTNGDPTYLLYYENFPAGEAIGWEVFTKSNARLVMPAPSDIEEMTVDEAARFLRNQRYEILGKYYEANRLASSQAILDTILYSNIVLENVVQENTFGPSVELPTLGILGDVGYWEDKGSYRFYKFQTYGLMPAVNKTLVKYRSCGPGNLCLKTREGIYAFPLDACEGKIDYVQLVYDVKGLYVDITNIDYIEKISDFYLASPCGYSEKIVIEKTQCNYGSYACKKMVSVPIYDVKQNDEKKDIMTVVGEHYECLDSIGLLNTDYGNAVSGARNCLRVSFISTVGKNDFCWTQSWPRVGTNTMQPVSASTEYNKEVFGIIVKGISVHEKLLNEYEEWSKKAIKTLGQFISLTKWTWPGFFNAEYTKQEINRITS
ncbi:MAG: hypothetical protein V1870_00365 [Candidatus Aenigmatarchaeota archaeon]